MPSKMGKTGQNKRPDAAEKSNADDKQQKISAFFQSGSFKANKSSSLFSTINQRPSAKLSLSKNKNATSKAVKESSKHSENDADVILMEAPTGEVCEKANIQNDKDVFALTGIIKKKTQRVGQSRKGNKTPQTCAKVSLCHAADVSPQTHLVSKNREEKDNKSVPEELVSESNGGEIGNYTKCTKQQERVDKTFGNLINPVFCSTPVKSLPDETEASGVESPDIVFDTPVVNEKKGLCLSHKCLFASDNQSATSLRNDKTEKETKGKMNSELERDVLRNKESLDCDRKKSLSKSKERELIHSSLYAVEENMHIARKTLPEPSLHKLVEDISDRRKSDDGIFPLVSSKSEKDERNEPFQPTLMKNHNKISKMYRTSSESKLLSALEESELNAKEKEIQQELKERVMGRIDMFQFQRETVESSGVTGNLKNKNKRALSSKPLKRKSDFSFDDPASNGFEIPIDFEDLEDNLSSNEEPPSLKEISTKLSDPEHFKKKVKKRTSKFIGNCTQPVDSKGDKPAVTLKDDPILKQLMNKLSPCGRNKENCGSKADQHQKHKKVLKSDKSQKLILEAGNKESIQKRTDKGKSATVSTLIIPDILGRKDRSSCPETCVTSSSVLENDPTDLFIINDPLLNEETMSHNGKAKEIERTFSMKRKLSDSESNNPCTKKASRMEECILITDENEMKGESNGASETNIESVPISIPSPKTPGDSMLQLYVSTSAIESEIPKSNAIIDLTSDTAQTDTLQSVQNLSFKSSSLLTNPEEKLSREDDKQSFVPDHHDMEALSDTLAAKLENEPFLESAIDLCVDTVPNHVFDHNQHSSANIETSFDFHDDSLLLAAAGNNACEDTIVSLINSGRKSDFCFTDSWDRFVIQTISENHDKSEKYLGLTKEKQSMNTHNCILKGFWADTDVRKGDIVNVLATFEHGQCVISDTQGFLVVNPDVLMSGTAVVSSVFCMRKSVLNEIVKGQDLGNTHMLFGRFLHSLFQAVLKDSVTDKNDIIDIAKTILSSSKFLHEMYSNSISEPRVWQEVNEYIPSLISWVSQHTPSGGTANKRKPDQIIVTDVQDIEENIWSPRLGLKGKIDLTVKVRSEGVKHDRILPLEVKTGKASFSAEHKGQVTLYSMMYGDRREEPGEGILLYLKHSLMELVKVKPQNQSGLIQLRNSMSSYLSHLVEQMQSAEEGVIFKLGRLPEPINNQRNCSKCQHLLTCCMYQRSVEKLSLSEKHAMKQLSSETLNHLDEADLDYFRHWALCLSLENYVSGKTKLKEIWTLSSKEREQRGDCLRSLMIVSSDLGIQETQGFTEGKGCSLTFVRHHSYEGLKLDTIGLSVNDHVVVSSEDGRLIALATGFIRSISSDHVEVVVDRDNLHDTSSYMDIMFRVDRNDGFSTHGTLMANISRLMEPTPHVAKLRNLIIKKMPPTFEMKIPMPWVKKMKPIFKDLNKPQKSAILKVLMSKDYVIIRGFPGTGKTSTIVALVKVLHTLNLSVLLTSYTHSAVDNILLKLKQDGMQFLRLGRQSRVHPRILPYSADILTTKLKSVQELTNFYASYDIVATSCLGMNHALFTRRRFDVCIVDEASQVLQPACLSPLFSCDKFVLVGDGQQLPPLVQSKEARLLGMDESLFSRLEESGATYDLNLQYRMNEVIMAVSNLLVYKGKLKCGSPDSAQQILALDTSLIQDSPIWIQEALSCDLKKSVTFIDTGESVCHGPDDVKGTSNKIEASIVTVLLESLLKANVSGCDIGVISPYRSQVKMLKRVKDSNPALTSVEVNTVDQYQGRDKSIIIVSFAYSSTSGGGGELLKDIRRLNVALTRAKCKLILIGNAHTLRSFDHLGCLLTHLEESGNIIQFSDFKEIQER